LPKGFATEGKKGKGEEKKWRSGEGIKNITRIRESGIRSGGDFRLYSVECRLIRGSKKGVGKNTDGVWVKIPM
jgi:hypothetical protein